MDAVSFLLYTQMLKILFALLFGGMLFVLTRSRAMFFLGQLLVWTIAPMFVVLQNTFVIASSWYEIYIFSALVWFGAGIVLFKATKEPMLVGIVQLVIGLMFAFFV